MNRKVRCPNCKALLTEPPPQTPIYQCAICSIFLQVKHAVSSNVMNGNEESGSEQERMHVRLVDADEVSSDESNRLFVPEMSDEYPEHDASSLTRDQTLYRCSNTAADGRTTDDAGDEKSLHTSWSQKSGGEDFLLAIERKKFTDESLVRHPDIYAFSNHGTSDDDEKLRCGDGSVQSEGKNIPYRMVEDMQEAGKIRSHADPVSEFSHNIRHVLEERTYLQEEEKDDTEFGVSSDDMDDPLQPHFHSDHTHDLKYLPYSSQVIKQWGTSEEAFLPASVFCSSSEAEVSSGEAVNDVHNESSVRFCKDGQQELVQDEAYPNMKDASNLTCWDISFNLNTILERDHTDAMNSSNDRNLHSGDRLEPGGVLEFQSLQVDKMSQPGTYGTSELNYSISKHPSVANEVDPLETEAPFSCPIKRDIREEHAYSSYIHQNGSKDAEFLGKELPQSLNSMSLTEHAKYYAIVSTDPMNFHPLHLSESRGDNCHVPETGTDNSGYKQSKYHSQDGKQVSYINERKQVDGNALCSQRVLKHGDGNNPERMVPARGVNFSMTNHQQFSDSQSSDHSAFSVQQEQYMGYKLEAERNVPQKGMASNSCAIYNFPVQSNRFQGRFPHNQQPVEGLTASAYSFSAPPQARTMPAPIHDHSFLCWPQQPAYPVCILCMQYFHMQHHQPLHGTLQHPCATYIPQHMCLPTAQQPLAHQYWASYMAHCPPPPPLYDPGFISSEAVCSAQVQHHEPIHPNIAEQVLHHEPAHLYSVEQVQHLETTYHNSLEKPSRKQKCYPLFPMECAVPYVLCQHCEKLLEVPSLLPTNNGDVQKLRCGACNKVSKFAILRPNGAGTMEKDLFSSDGSVSKMVEKKQVISSKAQPVIMGFNTTSALPKHHLPFILDEHGRNFYKMTEDGQCHMPSHHGYGNHQLLESNGISGTPTSLLEKSMLTKYLGPSTTTIQQQSTSSECYMHSVPDTTFQQCALRSRFSNNAPFITSSLPSRLSHLARAVDRNIAGNHKSEEHVNHRTLEGRMNSTSFSEWKVQVQDAKGCYPEGFPVAQEYNVREHDLGDPLGSKAQIDTSHQNANASCLKPAVVQGSPLHAHFGYRSPSELLNSSQIKVPASLPAKVLPKDTLFSRSSSVSYADLPSVRTAAPPPLERFSFESTDFDSGVQTKDSPYATSSSSRSFPWSPAGYYNKLAYDSSIDYDWETAQRAGKGRRQSDSNTHKGRKSVTGFLRKSIKDLAKGHQESNTRRGKVMVNGHVISDVVIKRVEKRTGIIHSGSYWYDFQAGFWGVMGGPCLGIIPPFIEDFNYPMPRDCTGGKTDIRVNGRELHQKDLELLALRGLPTVPGKAYSIDIDGRVVDEASGIQLTSLGKLAPTVEKRGQGFGMFQPATAPSGSSQS